MEQQDTATSGGGGAVTAAAAAAAAVIAAGVDGPAAGYVKASAGGISQSLGTGTGSSGSGGSSGGRGCGGNNSNDVSGSDEGSNEPGSAPPDPPSHPDASDLGMMGPGAADGGPQNVVAGGARYARWPEGCVSFSMAQHPGTRPSNGDEARKGNATADGQGGQDKAADGQLEVARAARASGLGWPGMIPGGTARAAQEEGTSMSPEPEEEEKAQQAAQQQQQQQREAAARQQQADMAAAAGPVASTVAYVGEQGSSGHDTGIGSYGHGSHQGPRSGQGSNEGVQAQGCRSNGGSDQDGSRSNRHQHHQHHHHDHHNNGSTNDVGASVCNANQQAPQGP